MKSQLLLLVFCIFQGYQCSSYERLFFDFRPFHPVQENTPKRDFDVFWNVPSFVCRRYGINFDEIAKQFDIIHNDKDDFQGEKFAILYDPGMFPAQIKNKDGTVTVRNGGVPQLGTLEKHLERFREDINRFIPNEKFDGYGVIDFERWKPIFRQNWGNQQQYKNISLKIVQRKNPTWSKAHVEKVAVEDFERAGRLFMEETLKLAKTLRPRANWTYYAYPYCYNESPNHKSSTCEPQAKLDNDRLSWLFNLETFLAPSLYPRLDLSHDQLLGLIEGRIREAIRLRRETPTKQIIPYFTYAYQDKTSVYLSREEMQAAVQKIFDSGADGFVIWGGSDDVGSKAKCEKLQGYLINTLGPVISNVKEATRTQTYKVEIESNFISEINLTDERNYYEIAALER